MGEWISIKERLPDPDTEVLTSMKHGLISGFYDPKEACFHGYYWQDMQWWATHWMPLPEPPK